MRGWHETPAARALFAACIANPPVRHVRNKSYAQTIDYWVEYQGWQVVELEKLRDDAGAKALALADNGKTAAEFDAWCAIPNVHDQIEALLVGGDIERARHLAGISEQMEAA